MALNDDIYVLREALTRTAQILAGKAIQVTQRGISAYVQSDATGKPILVNLPHVPDNATRELIDAIQGFLDHEVAHIYFTDFKLMGEAVKNGMGSMYNLLEDTRIERLMAERFEGSASNLGNTARFFLDKYTKPEMEKAIAEGDMQRLQGVLMMPLLRSMAGQTVFRDFIKDHMEHVEDIYDKIKDLAPAIAGLRESRDALTMAGTVMGRIKGSAVAPPPPPDPDAPPMPKMPHPPRGSGSKPPSAPDPDDKDPDDKDPDDKDPDDKDPDDTDPDADPDGAPAAGDPDAGGDDVRMGADDDPDASPHDAEPGGSTHDEGVEMDSATSSGLSWDDIDKELAKDYDETVSHVITNSAADSASHAEYLVYTKDKDVIEPLHVGKAYKDEYFTRMADDVDHMVGPLQKDLERAISARSLSQWQPGHRSGRLNASALSRVPTGDTRVFRRKTEVTTKDVAVELVVDISGSMSGSKVATASKTAYALASVLERIGIPCEVICFTTGGALFDDRAQMDAEMKKIGRPYSRMESLYMPVLKSFAERLTPDVRKRFAWLPNAEGLMANNVDGECVEVAARRLLTRKENGKIMLVLSDGAPHASGRTVELSAHLKKTVQAITKAGVNVVGIGIESNAVATYYPKYMVLNNVSELPVLVMKELRALIVK